MTEKSEQSGRERMREKREQSERENEREEGAKR